MMIAEVVEREDRHAAQRAAGEHVENTENAAGVLLENLLQRARIDPRHRNVGAKPIDDQRAQGEP
jgi:hypothetical protein